MRKVQGFKRSDVREAKPIEMFGGRLSGVEGEAESQGVVFQEFVAAYRLHVAPLQEWLSQTFISLPIKTFGSGREVQADFAKALGDSVASINASTPSFDAVWKAVDALVPTVLGLYASPTTLYSDMNCWSHPPPPQMQQFSDLLDNILHVVKGPTFDGLVYRAAALPIEALQAYQANEGFHIQWPLMAAATTDERTAMAALSGPPPEGLVHAIFSIQTNQRPCVPLIAKPAQSEVLFHAESIFNVTRVAPPARPNEPWRIDLFDSNLMELPPIDDGRARAILELAPNADLSVARMAFGINFE